MDMDIESLIERINAVAASHAEKNITEDLAARLKLLKAAEDLVAALKPPDMVVADMAFSVFHYASVRLALEMGMFEKLVLAERPLPVTELAASPTADTQLVLRIARSLAATGFLADVQTAEGQDAFTIAAAGRHAIVPSCRAGLKFHFDQNLPVVIHAPEFFRQNGFKIPSTQQDGLFQHVYQTEDDCYTYWFKQPGVMENFNTFMQGYFETIDFVRPISWFPYDQVCFSRQAEQC
ncbi:hypothetical protein CB0940_10220 [Cercospora beticola]|uniref:Uncharacterized protein n=1 Tax=Cercospora beticola TaxID=122368 RepID=A0A2G5HUS2_CERBT|nr:hypothetical protein CB0940_10220 [Cercospora beticola]PIA96297.1 hypothetical protein CB0940_10220 [Cercospora beticola]WPB06927.1 hypothetical protein RHO25_011587 [Cercospora beticola]CAK1366857.1 unnamed protein product [Cercospora beticola]